MMLLFQVVGRTRCRLDGVDFSTETTTPTSWTFSTGIAIYLDKENAVIGNPRCPRVPLEKPSLEIRGLLGQNERPVLVVWA